MEILIHDLSFLYKTIVLCGLLIFTAFVSARTPSRIEKDVHPFEGCQYGVWICGDSVKVYDREGDLSSFKFYLGPDDTLEALTGNIHYDNFGKVVVTKHIYAFLPNDTLTALRCCGEFSFYLYKDDSIYCKPIFWPILTYEDDLSDRIKIKAFQNELQDTTYAGIMIERPKVTWWIKITHDGKKGWIACKNETPYCFAIKENFLGMDLHFQN